MLRGSWAELRSSALADPRLETRDSGCAIADFRLQTSDFSNTSIPTRSAGVGDSERQRGRGGLANQQTCAMRHRDTRERALWLLGGEAVYLCSGGEPDDLQVGIVGFGGEGGVPVSELVIGNPGPEHYVFLGHGVE